MKIRILYKMRKAVFCKYNIKIIQYEFRGIYEKSPIIRKSDLIYMKDQK